MDESCIDWEYLGKGMKLSFGLENFYGGELVVGMERLRAAFSVRQL